jgi:outer membrane protein
MGALASAAKKATFPELSLYGMNDWAGSSAANGASTYKAGIVISFPLGDGGQRRGAQAEAAAGQSRADGSLKMIENRIQSEVASAWAQWQIVGVLARAGADELAAGNESFRIAMIRYKEGKAILAEVTEARAQVVKAELAVAQSIAFQEKAWSRLQRAIGAAS